MKERKPRRIVFILCLVLLIAAIAAVAGYIWQREKSEKTMSEVQDSVRTELSEAEEEIPETEEEETISIPVDFSKLQEENPDIYAWIYIADTNVDYPILQSETDDDYYLYRNMYGESDTAGSIYTQYSYNSGCFEDNVTVIYGHNMRNDSMFGQLSEYQDEEFRKEHSVIEIYTPEHIYTYRIVFAVTYNDSHLLASYNCDETDGCQDLLDAIRENRTIPSWIEDPFPVTAEDKLIILSTCNGNSSQRYLVGAVLEQTEPGNSD
ncbi:MAG: class B sortase [Lachnospiraceae bacterium]|nr:class B sortase [Lachnospiraceae bacterium]